MDAPPWRYSTSRHAHVSFSHPAGHSTLSSGILLGHIPPPPWAAALSPLTSPGLQSPSVLSGVTSSRKPAPPASLKLRSPVASDPYNGHSVFQCLHSLYPVSHFLLCANLSLWPPHLPDYRASPGSTLDHRSLVFK